MIERPAWVHRCLAEINEAYFEAFGRLMVLASAEMLALLALTPRTLGR